MSTRVAEKVALVTGAARGQGRAHAVRLAQEGADIIAIDVAEQIDFLQYPSATEDDLAETVRQVESLGRKIFVAQADTRDEVKIGEAIDGGVAALGQLDIVVANAGVFHKAAAVELGQADWLQMIDINLTGTWNTVKAAMPHLVSAERGGSIVLISSVAGQKGQMNSVHYNAAKHGVVGIMRTLANELAPHMIRVNAVLPTSVNTDMIQNKMIWGLFDPANPNPTKESATEAFKTINSLPIPWVEPVDVANAVLFLASDEARYITGVCLPVDAGNLNK